jgi:hypothetical protein
MRADMRALVRTLRDGLAICADRRVPLDRIAGIAVQTLALCGGESAEWARVSVREVADAIATGSSSCLPGRGSTVPSALCWDRCWCGSSRPERKGRMMPPWAQGRVNRD